MAAILHSSVIKTAHRGFSGGGTLSVRALHTGRKVDPLFKKIDDVATKELLLGYTRLVKELKSSTSSLLGKPLTLQCLFSVSAIGTYMLGYQVGFNQSQAEKCQASSGKQA